MIRKVGVLPICGHQQVPFAYKKYTRTDMLGWQQSTAFKKAFCIHVKIDFLGVWYASSHVRIWQRADTFLVRDTVSFIPGRLPFRRQIPSCESSAMHYCWMNGGPVSSRIHGIGQSMTKHSFQRLPPPNGNHEDSRHSAHLPIMEYNGTFTDIEEVSL
jgi:hypothetical protein